MPVYADTYLPSEAELTVPEVNLTSGYMRASAYHVGKKCDEESKEFMLCRKEEKDPRKCINEGKVVTACAMTFFKQLKTLCKQEFEAYGNCITKGSVNFSLKPCRKTQKVYDQCVFEKMGIERPELGYFSLPRVHQTTRPKPIIEKQEYPDKPAELPDDYPREPAKYGARTNFVY